jgi:hypothetical protein
LNIKRYISRENSREQRQMYIERVVSIREQRQTDLVSKKEKKEEKEQRERVKKEELTEKLQEIGGLWKTPDEVDRKVKALSGTLSIYICLCSLEFSLASFRT